MTGECEQPVDFCTTRRKYSSLGRPDLIRKPGFAFHANPFSGIMCHWHIIFIRFTPVGSTPASMLTTVLQKPTDFSIVSWIILLDNLAS